MAGNKHSQKKGGKAAVPSVRIPMVFSLSMQNKLNPLLAPYGNDH